MWIKENCLTTSIRYKLKNTKAKISFSYPEIFLFTMNIKHVSEYMKYLKENNIKWTYLLSPHFFILDGDYKIEFTDKGIIRNKYKNFKVGFSDNFLMTCETIEK